MHGKRSKSKVFLKSELIFLSISKVIFLKEIVLFLIKLCALQVVFSRACRSAKVGIMEKLYINYKLCSVIEISLLIKANNRLKAKQKEILVE